MKAGFAHPASLKKAILTILFTYFQRKAVCLHLLVIVQAVIKLHITEQPKN
jgi:hypothetical protein